MIVLKIRICNNKENDFKEKYNEIVIANFHKFNLFCPYCKSYNIVGHGTYKRYLLNNGNVDQVDIYRIKCQDCGHTNAIITLDITPWFYVDTNTSFIYVVNNKINTCNGLLKNLIEKRIKKRLKTLNESYIRALGIDYSKDSLIDITYKIYSITRRLFLQTHRGKVFFKEVPT